MASAYHAAGWDFGGIEHGFAFVDAPIAPNLRAVRVRQVHGDELRVVDEKSPDMAGEADGLLTATPGLAVAIATADCVPVLFAAPEKMAVAAVHAGWRGSLAGIVPKTVAAFAQYFDVPPASLRVALGPSIGGCCYQVERSIAEQFADRFGQGIWPAWRDDEIGKGTLDLRAINAQLLTQVGVAPQAITRVGPCTACGGGPLASYRIQGAAAGRQLSWIGLRP